MGIASQRDHWINEGFTQGSTNASSAAFPAPSIIQENPSSMMDRFSQERMAGRQNANAALLAAMNAYASQGYAPITKSGWDRLGAGRTNEWSGDLRRIETPKDRALAFAKELMGEWKLGKDGGGGDGPDLSPYKVPTGPAITDDALTVMMNQARSNPIAQAQSRIRQDEARYAGRGMGGSPILDVLRNMSMGDAVASGNEAATRLNYDTQAANAKQNLASHTAAADSWNAYQNAKVNKYQAQNSIRNAILNVIGSLG